MAFIKVGGIAVALISGPPVCLQVTNTKKAGFISRLFPFGAYWSRVAGWLPDTARGIARFISRYIRRVEAWVRQWDPRTADELLPEWEQLFEIIPTPIATLEDRRDAVLARVRSTGGTTAAYYESVALDFGYVAVVTDAGNPATCNSTCIDGLFGGEWLLTFLVTTPTQGAARDALLVELISGQPLLAGWFAVYDFT